MPRFSKVADMWLKAKKPNIRHSTYKQYKGHLKNHLKPYFENYKISHVNYDKVDVPPQMMKQFKKWKLACPGNDLGLVFPNETGGPMSSLNMYNRKFLPVIKKAGLQIRFHDLRHTWISLLIDQGENIKYIQNQAGHSSIKTTIDTYGHLMKDVNKEAASRLGNAIFEQNGSKMVAETKKEVTV